jgi:hypothetical protein
VLEILKEMGGRGISDPLALCVQIDGRQINLSLLTMLDVVDLDAAISGYAANYALVASIRSLFAAHIDEETATADKQARMSLETGTSRGPTEKSIDAEVLRITPSLVIKRATLSILENWCAALHHHKAMLLALCDRELRGEMRDSAAERFDRVKKPGFGTGLDEVPTKFDMPTDAPRSPVARVPSP